MRQSRNYQSPYAAAFWSLLLPGFGQLYNKDFVVGFFLIFLEFLINLKSNLNLALIYTFKVNIVAAHQIIDYRWGLFYPSLYGFAVWQAFNHARVNNQKLAGTAPITRTYLSGLFIGLAIGMDFGLFWNDNSFFKNIDGLKWLDYPVVDGLVFGLLFAILGVILENKVYRKLKARYYSLP